MPDALVCVDVGGFFGEPPSIPLDAILGAESRARATVPAMTSPCADVATPALRASPGRVRGVFLARRVHAGAQGPPKGRV